MVVDEDFVEKLAHCDFFAGTRESFYQNIEKNTSFRVHGAHRDPAPLVSVIITTYKRPEWLAIALESALNQESFDDYEIIVVDNEGENPEIETETSRLVSSYHDRKIVYYRNFPPAYYKMNTAVSLSRSKWFCIIHDDDFISKDHLKIMTGILNERPDIGYLACSHQPFDAKDEAVCRTQSGENVDSAFSLVLYPDRSACAGCNPGWLGALIDRENYINMGGMFSFASIADFIMVIHYMNRYNSVWCVSTKPSLYFYRISTAQLSAGGSGTWLKSSMEEYMLYKYLAKKYHPGCTSFWNYIASIIIHDKIKNVERREAWLKGDSINREPLERLAGLPLRNAGGMRRWLGKRLLSGIRRHYIGKN